MGKKGLTPPNFEDLTGVRFGRLVVVKKAERLKSNTTRWQCKCDCGNVIETTRTSLIKGCSKSCGCYAKEVTSKRSSKYNRYDLSNECGTGYTTNTDKPFYFDMELLDEIKKYAWHENAAGYIATRDKETRKTLYFHQLVLEAPIGKQIDHINRNKADNRLKNLRIVDSRQNSFNKSILSNNKSGVLGVYYDSERKKWAASLGIDGRKHFKRFDEKSDAVHYRKQLEKKYFGQYAPK